MARVFDVSDTLSFGKHKGKTVDIVARSDPQYIRWVKYNVPWADFTEEAYSLAVNTGFLQSDERADNYGTAADWGFDDLYC